jgi:hypothetical protein
MKNLSALGLSWFGAIIYSIYVVLFLLCECYALLFCIICKSEIWGSELCVLWGRGDRCMCLHLADGQYLCSIWPLFQELRVLCYIQNQWRLIILSEGMNLFASSPPLYLTYVGHRRSFLFLFVSWFMNILLYVSGRVLFKWHCTLWIVKGGIAPIWSFWINPHEETCPLQGIE